MLWSNGRNEARAYVTAEVPRLRPEPVMDSERVKIVDPRHTLTLPGGPPFVGSAPRNPDQKVWALPPPAEIELPDRRPATKAQRVFIDPALVARWRAEAGMNESA